MPRELRRRTAGQAGKIGYYGRQEAADERCDSRLVNFFEDFHCLLVSWLILLCKIRKIGWGAQANNAITSKSIVDSSEIENPGTNVDFAVSKIVW